MVNNPQEGNCFPEDSCLHKELLMSHDPDHQTEPLSPS